MKTHPWRAGLMAGSLCAALGLLAACEKPPVGEQHAKPAEDLARIEARLAEIEKKQQAALEGQQKLREDLDEKLAEIRPGVIQLKALRDCQKERELAETPAEQVRRSMSEVRSIATAAQSFATDMSVFPEMGPAGPYVSGDLKFCRVVDIARQISPNYIWGLPAWDPWGNPYLYWASEKRDHFLVVCMGADGRLDTDAHIAGILKEAKDRGYAIPAVQPGCLEADIAWHDDLFLLRPQGPLRRCGGGQ